MKIVKRFTGVHHLSKEVLSWNKIRLFDADRVYIYIYISPVLIGILCSYSNRTFTFLLCSRNIVYISNLRVAWNHNV